jgi:hypothetical protein
MILRLGLPLAAVALLLGGASASAEPATPLALSLSVASRDDPHVGRAFVGYVLVLPAAARRDLVSVRARCHGTILRQRVPARSTRAPERRAVPSVLLCTWAIPRDKVGWTFRGRREVEVPRRLPDGSLQFDTDEGRTTAWIVQP